MEDRFSDWNLVPARGPAKHNHRRQKITTGPSILQPGRSPLGRKPSASAGAETAAQVEAPARASNHADRNRPASMNDYHERAPVL